MSVVPGQFRTFRGHLIQVQNPKPEHIDILDIARALSYEVRYGGHVRKRLCVAEHCCHMYDLIAEPNQDGDRRRYPRDGSPWRDDLDHEPLYLQTLLHDATEAYLKDLPKPIKMLCPDYEALEDALWLHIANRFNIPPQLDPLVKQVDVAIREAERMVVHGTKHELDPILGNIEPKLVDWGWDQERAENEFLNRFQKLLGDDWVKYTFRRP